MCTRGLWPSCRHSMWSAMAGTLSPHNTQTHTCTHPPVSCHKCVCQRDWGCCDSGHSQPQRLTRLVDHKGNRRRTRIAQPLNIQETTWKAPYVLSIQETYAYKRHMHTRDSSLCIQETAPYVLSIQETTWKAPYVPQDEQGIKTWKVS